MSGYEFACALTDGVVAEQLARAVESGLVGAGLVDRDGKVIAIAGELDDDEAMPLASLVMYRNKSADLSERLFDGDVIAVDLDGRDVALAIAKRQLFVVALLKRGDARGRERVAILRDRIAGMLASDAGVTPAIVGWGSGGGGAGPAPLPVVEWGVTVSRRRPKT